MTLRSAMCKNLPPVNGRSLPFGREKVDGFNKGTA